MTRTQMHLGLFLHGTGSHIAGWRPQGAMDSNQKLSYLQAITAEAERAKFDLVFVGDSLSSDPNTHPSYAARIEPLVLLSALAMGTKHIGLAATASTTYSQPYSIARAFASLDNISNGRAAWNAVTTTDSAAGANFGVTHPNHAQRYEIAEEFVQVVKGLWDCWDDDALVADRKSGVFIDPTKVRSLDFHGRFFNVKGPLNIGRSPQGHPIMIQAGGSPAGKALASKIADIVFSVVQDLDEAKVEYADFKKLVEAAGRKPANVTVMPGVMPVVGESDKDAREKLNWLQGFVNDENNLVIMSDRLGIDLTGYDLDGPIPDVEVSDRSQAFARSLLAKAKREDMTLRDLYGYTAASRGHWVLCGSAETVANTLIRWFEEGAADGFNVMPAYFPNEFDDFTQKVIPILQDKKKYRKEYTGTTLRNHLGLERPSNLRVK